ncbi:MAG TPA: hypothetical protein VFE53_15565 [Mucilaginibacter sp.]|jgi:hypothetical protein|nr:hypothetical protein [Mucilaginibacter sp.]
MTTASKKTFLFTTIIGSFLVYSLIYYAQVFNHAPYNFSEFKSFVFKYGSRDSMVNYYNSATGEYDYLDKHNVLIKKHVFLTKLELDSLHVDARQLGFWDFPQMEVNTDTTSPGFGRAPRYFIQFNYKRRSKQVLFDADYSGPIKLIDANKIMIKKITNILSGAEDRQKK